MSVSPKTRSVVFISVICLGITTCEWLFAYMDVTYGIIAALLLALAVYLVIPLSKLGRAFTDSAESLVLLPLYILLTSSLPWFFLDQQLLIPAVYTAVLALCAWHVYRKNISLSGIGFSNERLVRYILIGIMTGIPLGALEYFIITPTTALPTFEIKYFVRDLIYMTLFVGLGEELLFRGLIQKDMINLLGWKWGLLGASLMFGIMHLTWRSIPELVFTSVAGFIFGYFYLKTGKLTAPIIAHGVGNAVLVGIMPYLFQA